MRGDWRYLYRAIDRAGALVDVMLSEHRHLAAAKADPDLRQHSHAGLNKGEASNSVRRAVFFHHQGEIRDRPNQQESIQIIR